MERKIHQVNRLQYYALLVSIFSCCFARDFIAYDNPVRDNGETLVSAGERFELGFFTPNGSSSGGIRRYVGIWYKLSPKTVVWVANRETPVRNYNGVFRIRYDGNLQVCDEVTEESHCWHTDIGIAPPRNLTAKLMDSGNLVLGKALWESFENPADTFLPGMKMKPDLKLTSWREKDDPAPGSFGFKLDDRDPDGHYMITNGSVPYWKSGGKFASSNTMITDIIDYMSSNITAFRGSQITLITKSRDKKSTRLVITFDGRIAYRALNTNDTDDLDSLWYEPADRCGVYKACGEFGICDLSSAPPCNCLPGFEPRYAESWSSGDFLDGCTTKPCGETFLDLTKMNVREPDSTDSEARNETECRDKCLGSCACNAYSFGVDRKSTYNRGFSRTLTACSMWTEALTDLQKEYPGGLNLSVRIAHSVAESGEHERSKPSSRKSTPLPLVIVPTALSVVALAFAFIVWRRKRLNKHKKKRSDQRSKELLKLDSQKRIKHLISSGESVEEDELGIDVPFISFETIVAATDDFSDENKLGQGGYGPVYKGKFQGGQEIAVKRLSAVSGQGLQEFKNEVVLIAKLQHRNLVRLRGYCIKRDEKILLYEYMPNRSLDFFIFDKEKSKILDWEKRFNIVLGIARGLLYLHQDSRLRIIHRDLKTSNILLDQDMEPKISDFGLARIVGGKQTEASTERVVGTYGYMSPEYALEGLFSVKSDAFSFGVVLLEIISGKRNTRLVQLLERPLSLLGYAWRLWTENRAFDLMDHALRESCNDGQFLKCVKVALLCVQEDPSERPTMSTVFTMLDSESAATVPNPQQPAFVLKTGPPIASSSSSKPEETQGEITVTLEEGR